MDLSPFARNPLPSAAGPSLPRQPGDRHAGRHVLCISARLWLVLACLALPLATAWAAPAKATQPYPWGHPGCPCSEVLQAGTVQSAGLVQAPLQDLDDTVRRALARRVAPGAVVLVARRGVIAKWKAYGYAALYTNADYDKMAHPVPMQKDTIFDLASVSKLFTATAVMQLWDEGKIQLDAPVAKYLPKFAAHGKQDVTVRQLLTHTSGLRPDPLTPIFDVPGTRQQRLDYVLQLPLGYRPGTRYVYSDSNFITLGALVEKLSGEREDVFLRKHLTGPLHMDSTLYNPPASLRPRIAASEYQPWNHRGLLRGQVEDGNAWALGGVAGHAGLFSDAHDLAIFGQMMLNGGTYDGVRVLSQKAVKLLLTNWNKKFPEDATGLGWSIDRGYLMGALTGPHTAGHEGYTGTMIVINKPNDVVAVLLTNRVHPTRIGASAVTAIRQVMTKVAAAIPVAVPGGGKAWFSGYGNFLNRDLTARVEVNDGETLSFQTWYRTMPGNGRGLVETSADGKHWKTLARLSGSSHGWQRKSLPLPAGTQYVRFLYRTVSYGSHFEASGRGWYVHDVKIGTHAVTAWNTAKTDWLRRDY